MLHPRLWICSIILIFAAGVTSADPDFWKHEWEKHGSCVFTEINELTYFKTTLSLFVDAVQTNIIEKYKKNEIQSLIPISLDFKIISN